MRRLFPVVFSLSFSLSFVAAGTPPPGVARSTAGEQELIRAGAPMEGRARLMAPEVYDRLSSGGRRLARSWNGLRGPARVGTPRAALGSVQPLGTPVARQNVRVNDPTLDEAGHTNSESSVAVSGSTIVVGFNDAAVDTSAYAFSTDGGATFTHRRLSPPFDGLLYGDPVVAAGPAADVYYASLISVAGDALSSIGVSKSTDGGQTFGAPVDAVNANTFTDEIMDKPWLAVDAGAGSKYRGNVYVSWTFLNTSTGEVFILFARSADGGLTFSAPGILSPDDTVGVQGSSIAVGPAGEVYVAWLDEHLSPSGISIRKSSDGGANFGPTVTVATFHELTTLTGGGGVRANSFPGLAVDGAGRVQVTWAAQPDGKPSDRADVFHSRSTDGGATFSTPRRLNDDSTSTSQAFPAIAASPDGRVAVRWIDRRNDPVNDALTDVFLAISSDGGATFGPSFRVTDTSWAYGPVDPGLGAGYHGDYDGLAWAGGTFFVTWSDERGSDPDVYLAPVPEGFDPATPDLDVTSSAPWAGLPGGGQATFDLGTSGLGGFAGPVSFSLTPPGAGVSASFDRGQVPAGQASRLTLSSTSQTTSHEERLTVTAEGGGLRRSTLVRATAWAAGRGVPPPLNVTNTRGFTGGEARVDPEGRIHVLYDDDSDNVLGSNVFYRRSTDGGATFSSPVQLTASGAVGFDTALAVGASGRVVAVWAGRGSGDTQDRVFVARSSDGGGTFSAPVAISPASQSGEKPAVAIDAAGNVLVAWYDFVPSVAVLYTARSTDGGATFGTAVAISESSVGVVTRPGLAFDSKGAAYLVYTQQYTTVGLASVARLAIARDGKTFAAPVSLTDPLQLAAFGPDVAVAPNDAVHVVFYVRFVDSTGFYSREVLAAHSADAGATFSAPVNVSSNSGQSWFPTVAVEPGGAVVVAWEDDTGRTASDILLSRSTDGGATFSAPVGISEDFGLSGSTANAIEGPGWSGRVQVSAAASGSLVVSWLDDSAANPDVFLVRLDPKALTNHAPTASITSPSSNLSVEAGVPVTFAGSGSDPDGDPVTFAWSFGDGASAAGAAPAAHPFARPGAYTATLTVTDPYGASVTASVALNVTAPTVTGTSLLIPVVLEADGVGGSHYQSELTLVSRATSPTEVLLGYTASLGAGTGFARLTLAAGEQRVVPGVIGFLRGRGLAIPSDGSSQAGTLLVTFAGVADGVFAGVRTFTADPAGGGGTFGVFYPAASTTTGPATVFGLQQNASQRSNLALVNAGSSPVTLRTALFGSAGEALGLLPDETLPPWGWVQVDQPLSGKAAAGRAVVTLVAGSGPFTAYGVLNDAATSDGSFLTPLLGDDGTGASRLVPVVLDVEGVGARFRTELTLANLTSAPLPLTLSYRAAAGFGSGSGSVPLTLAPLEQRVIPDAIAFLRQALPIEADGRNVGGALLVEAPTGTPASALAVGARTFAPRAPSGSFGLFYAGLTAGEAATDSAWVYGLREDAAERSNLALVNRGDAGGEVSLRVSFFDGLGAPLGAPVVVTLAPLEWKQLDRPLLERSASAGYAKVERVSGTSRFVAYGVRNDNASSDGSYVPMTR